MVGAVLTQNTAWTNVERAIDNFKRVGGLTPDAIRRMGEKELALLIRPAGYYNIKARRLKELIDFLYMEYDGDLQRISEEPLSSVRDKLLNVKGIGPETADSILLYAVNRPIFVVDAYTKRVLLRHNLIKKNSTYQEIQYFFMRNLPENVELFKEFHALLVRLGKTHCKPKPICLGCPAVDVWHMQRSM